MAYNVTIRILTKAIRTTNVITKAQEHQVSLKLKEIKVYALLCAP